MDNLKKVWKKERQGKKKQLIAFYKEVVQTLEEVLEKQDTDIVQGIFYLIWFLNYFLSMHWAVERYFADKRPF